MFDYYDVREEPRLTLEMIEDALEWIFWEIEGEMRDDYYRHIERED